MVISNCVINLSTDKPAVLAEMFRVLVPGGRIGISDVVAEDHLTAADRAAAGSYVGCIAGALSRTEYLDGLAAAGFADASVTFTTEAAPGMHSAIIRAVKPPRHDCRCLPGGCWPSSPGTGLLVAIVVGSGIAATRLTDDAALRLLVNSLVTALGLAVLILVFTPAGGAHFNPVVTAADWLLGRRTAHRGRPGRRRHRLPDRRGHRRGRTGRRHVRPAQCSVPRNITEAARRSCSARSSRPPGCS